MEAPVIFICRNNGWAISTPVSDQFRSIFPSSFSCSSILLFPIAIPLKSIIFVCICSLYSFAGDGVVVRGRAYGVRSLRVDGNDALAMYTTVRAAREMAITEHRPILIEVNWESIQPKKKKKKINAFRLSEKHKQKN